MWAALLLCFPAPQNTFTRAPHSPIHTNEWLKSCKFLWEQFRLGCLARGHVNCWDLNCQAFDQKFLAHSTSWATASQTTQDAAILKSYNIPEELKALLILSETQGCSGWCWFTVQAFWSNITIKGSWMLLFQHLKVWSCWMWTLVCFSALSLMNLQLCLAARWDWLQTLGRCDEQVD